MPDNASHRAVLVLPALVQSRETFLRSFQAGRQIDGRNNELTGAARGERTPKDFFALTRAHRQLGQIRSNVGELFVIVFAQPEIAIETQPWREIRLVETSDKGIHEHVRGGVGSVTDPAQHRSDRREQDTKINLPVL